ncbi:MAG TPA: hypothetical protein VKA67_01285, partial [Verrucomicrobiae bacterium]|nr:hypothetical protein [Verrucomicrobiae bacterium]
LSLPVEWIAAIMADRFRLLSASVTSLNQVISISSSSGLHSGLPASSVSEASMIFGLFQRFFLSFVFGHPLTKWLVAGPSF